MTSIMWPTRSRTSHPVQRVITFQFFGSDTKRVKLARSRRMTLMTVSLPSAAIGLTGAIVAVLISSFPSPGEICDHVCSSVTGAGRRRGRNDDRRQGLVQPVTPHLEPGRQAETRAEGLRFLVDGETGAVGGDLEQHAA